MSIYTCTEVQKTSKKKCEKCGYYFSLKAGNYKKHINSCDGNYKAPGEKAKNCKYCGLDFSIDISQNFKMNHIRWCDKNPNRENYRNKESISAMNSKRKETGYTNQYEKARLLEKEIPISPLKGTTKKGNQHTEETKKIISEKRKNI